MGARRRTDARSLIDQTATPAPPPSSRVRQRRATSPRSGRERLEAWFAGKGWTPWDFQRHAWDAYALGRSGLIQVPTGAGKTYAAFGGPLAEMMDLGGHESPRPSASSLHTLYITPLRAVTRDIELALKAPVADLGLHLSVESRTGDTSASMRARQRERLPRVLVTTPESLCLLLTRENAREVFAGLACVIVDEWHELLVSKRGTSVELALARLRRWSPALRTWGMSATLPNTHEAMATLLGRDDAGVVVRGAMERPVAITCVIPKDLARLPWAGHLGLAMLPDVLDELDPQVPTIVFTNTRSQAERWHAAIAYQRPDWAQQGWLALHHGSVDREERERVEAGLKDGSLRIVVSTSSLDLGVDFSPVQKVLQIGSPKGIARIVQRAGRANHSPGQASEVRCVPTHALELLEVAAARAAFAAGQLEAREAMAKPLDVLAQHMVTCALGGGFRDDDLYDEVRTAWSYRQLTRQEFDWALELVSVGGVLKHYPQFQRIARDDHGVWRVPQPRIAQLHRLNVGTITGDATLEIRYASGKRLGTIDEGFVAQLRPGEKFVFAGKVLAFVTIKDLVVIVRPHPGTTNNTPLWAGTRLPISESLSSAMREALEQAGSVHDHGGSGTGARAVPTTPIAPELLAAGEIIRVQQRLSIIPRADELLAEIATSREGTHVFLFPFEGRLVHAGLAAILALRLGRRCPGSFALAANDYGLEILSAQPYPFAQLFGADLFSSEQLAEDAAQSVNMSQLARLAFREIARVAGLVMQNYPGTRRTGKQLQASSSLIFDVYRDFDPSNMLLEQARREVLDKHFEQGRLGRLLARARSARLRIVQTPKLTPLAFPLVVERVATKMSSQTIAERLEAMKKTWGAA